MKKLVSLATGILLAVSMGSAQARMKPDYTVDFWTDMNGQDWAIFSVYCPEIGQTRNAQYRVTPRGMDPDYVAQQLCQQ